MHSPSNFSLKAKKFDLNELLDHWIVFSTVSFYLARYLDWFYMNYSFMLTKYYFTCVLIFTLLTFVWLHKSRILVQFCFPSLDEEQHWLNHMFIWIVLLCWLNILQLVTRNSHCLHESRLWIQFCFPSLDEEQH